MVICYNRIYLRFIFLYFSLKTILFQQTNFHLSYYPCWSVFLVKSSFEVLQIVLTSLERLSKLKKINLHKFKINQFLLNFQQKIHVHWLKTSLNSQPDYHQSGFMKSWCLKFKYYATLCIKVRYRLYYCWKYRVKWVNGYLLSL